MRKITLANGETVEVECLSCAITEGLITPDGGTIAQTENFHAHQDVAYPIPGLVIVASKRHVYGLDELSDVEAKEYIHFVQRIRRAQRNLLGMNVVYYFYNEDTTHHFHLWMVPRYDWMYKIGRSVESLRPVLLHARETMNDEPHRTAVFNAIERLRMNLRTP